MAGELCRLQVYIGSARINLTFDFMQPSCVWQA